MKTIESFVILGGGSAGFLAALALRVRFPHLPVTLIRSPQIGIIGVGEGTFSSVPMHLHGYLGIDPSGFHAATRTTWKLGTKFLWGKRDHFFYTFDRQTEERVTVLPRPNGYYAFDDFSHASPRASLMEAGMAFTRQASGAPLIDHHVGYHIENERFVAFLENRAAAQGVAIVDGTVASVAKNDAGIESLLLEDGRRFAADFFVDSSGFAARLIHQEMGAEYESFANTLFCDRAVVGGWERGPDEPILPYTTSETMDAGWCWRIEHPEKIIRGYVYGSAFISDDAAEAEYRRKNPKAGPTRIVKFKSGAHRHSCLGNVMAVGNASGFVEPLEATAIAFVCSQTQALADGLYYNDRRMTPTLRDNLNAIVGDGWANILEFLAVHYKFNDRLATPFWRASNNDISLGRAQAIVDYYRENGPNSLMKHRLERRQEMFGLEGFYTLLIGLKVPFRASPRPAHEHEIWNRYRAQNHAAARNGYPVEEALRVINMPEWSWNPDFYAALRPQ